jgi:hypothetical protein
MRIRIHKTTYLPEPRYRTTYGTVYMCEPNEASFEYGINVNHLQGVPTYGYRYMV